MLCKSKIIYIYIGEFADYVFYILKLFRSLTMSIINDVIIPPIIFAISQGKSKRIEHLPKERKTRPRLDIHDSPKRATSKQF